MWMRMIHPDDHARVLAESNRTNETGEDYDIEHRIVRKDGRVVWVHDHAFLVRSADGDDDVAGVLTDITDRKLAEDALTSATASSRRPDTPRSGSSARPRGGNASTTCSSGWG